MNEKELLCPGLDGSDPLTLLASLGLFSTGVSAGLLTRMSWRWQGGWRPVFQTAASEAELIDCVIEALVGHEAATARTDLECLERDAERLARELELAETAFAQAQARATKREAKAQRDALKAALKQLKAQVQLRESQVNRLATAAVEDRHAVVGIAQHLDEISAGGLSRGDFTALASSPHRPAYLHGLACDADLAVKKKSAIARTHLSFANRGSNKMLLKDFAGVARLVTAARVEDALFGEGTWRDSITGLGWDPASQRSYALQFRNPEKEVICQPVHHALGLLGLAFFPVVPFGEDRRTLGVYAFATDSQGAEPEEEGEDGEETAPARRREEDHLVWPLWDPLLGPEQVQSLLARPEWAQAAPPADRCRALGVLAVMRSRRFSANKRSYFAPARPVV